MKKRLYLKLGGCYLLFAVIGFILVSTFTSNLAFKYVEKNTAENLYRESVLISNNYAAEYFKKNVTLEDLQSHLETLDAYLSAQIWVVNPSGKILVNSRNPVSDFDTADTIDGFDVTDFGNSYYDTGDFYGYFSDDELSVYAPITSKYKVIGYVFIHMPTNNIFSLNNGLLNISYITWGILCGLVLVILLIVAVTIVHPIQKISKTAGKYADGHFEEQLSIHSNDELGYLSASLNCIANEMNTLEDDQRKFISNVSHDFRSPLTSIKGYVEAILDGTIPVEMQGKYLNIILFETERLTKLTRGLLELNKYGSHGRTILDISNFDVNGVIKQTALAFEGTCMEKRISFELILTGQDLFVSADMSKIQQVIYNLIDNAIKFSHHDSSITIETTVKNEKVFVSVKDHGVGIPKESLSKIWERFFKTDSSRGKDKKGTGLGLSIVKEIVQAHGENINVISTEGVGTEFIFTLPLAKEHDSDLV